MSLILQALFRVPQAMSSMDFLTSLLLSLLVTLGKASTSHGSYIKAIYNFGDSISDTGNFPYVNPDGAFALRFPYGVTIGEPTGRFSDGLIMIDYFALKLGLPLLPPYLDKNATFANGVNFAVGGATALDTFFLQSNNITNPSTNNSLGIQLGWFHAHKSSLCSSEKECAKMFERSLFFVGEFGANDINAALSSSKTIEETAAYSPFVVRKIISAAEEVIKAGAVKVVIPGNLPFGCSPYFLTTLATSDSDAYDQNGCFVPLNQLIQDSNRQLKEAIVELRKKHPSINIMYADFYGAFTHLFTKAHLYGFDKGTLTKACCGIGGRYNFDPNRRCGTPEATVCRSPSRYIFWDSVHLTQEAYRIMAMELLSRGLIGPGIGL